MKTPGTGAGVVLLVHDRARRRLLRVLGALTLLLVVVSTAFAVAVPRPSNLLVDSSQRLLLLDAEANLAAWWSSSLWLLGGLLLGAAALQARRRAQQAALGLLSVLLIFLSADESAVLHERLAGILEGLGVGSEEPGGTSWVLVAVPVLLVFVLGVRRLKPDLPRDVVKRLALALAALTAGAAGFEVLGYALYEEQTRPYLLVVAVEEGLEYLAALLGIDAALRVLRPAQPSSSPSPRAQDVV